MKLKTITRKIAYTGLFSAFAVVLNIFTLPDTPLGTISFVYIPCFLAGIILGPFLGFTVGFVGDFLGCIISPKGPLSISILLSSGLIGLLCGVVFKVVRGEKIALKMLFAYFAVLIVCTLGFSSVGNYIVSGALQNKYLTFWHYLLISRLPRQPFILLINCLITYSIIRILIRQIYFRRMFIKI